VQRRKPPASSEQLKVALGSLLVNLKVAVLREDRSGGAVVMSVRGGAVSEIGGSAASTWLKAPRSRGVSAAAVGAPGCRLGATTVCWFRPSTTARRFPPLPLTTILPRRTLTVVLPWRTETSNTGSVKESCVPGAWGSHLLVLPPLVVLQMVEPRTNLIGIAGFGRIRNSPYGVA
jgi:hypothetical protein